MSLKNDLVALLYQQNLNTSASSLIIANGTVEAYLPTFMKVVFALFGAWLFVCILLLIWGGWVTNRPVTLFLLLMAVYYRASLQIDLSGFKNDYRFYFPDDQPSLALLKGDSIHLGELIRNIYNSGYTLRKLSYELYENGQLFNYTTQLRVGGYHYYRVGYPLLGSHTVDVGTISSIYGEIFELT